MAREPEAYLEDNLFEIGIGHVVVARFKSGNRVEVGTFLVDVYCLGIKDAFYRLFDEAGFKSECLGWIFKEGIPSPKPAACGRKLVEKAVIYAATLGFAPHPDFKKAARVFGGVDASECDEEFVFGSGGKPLYIQGPYEEEAQVEQILSVLRARCGEDGFQFVVPGAGDWKTEDEEVGIVAIDSEAVDGKPDRLLKEFVQGFMDRRGEFDHIQYGGKDASIMAADLLLMARNLRSEMVAEGETEMSLNTALKFVQTLWNLRSLPPEDREEALNDLPGEIREILESIIEESGETSPLEERLIYDFLLLNASVPGEERLFLLVEDS